MDEEPGPGQADRWFAENLRSARERAGMSQGSLAGRMAAAGWPFHQQTITRIEGGTRRPHLGEARALAALVGCDLATLMRPPEQAAALLALRRAARETRRAHGEAVRWAAEFRHCQASLPALAETAAGTDGEETATALAEAARAAALAIGDGRKDGPGE